MTTAAVGPVTLGGVIRSEWVKFRSVRSTIVVLALTVVVMVVSSVTGPRVSYNPIDQAVFGTPLATFTTGILGVLTVTGEYATGMIAATFCAVPRRLPVLWAKGAAFSVVVFTVMVATALAAFTAGQARYGAGAATLATPGALRSVTGTAVYLTLAGLLGVGLGFLTRSTAGGVTAVIGFTFVLPQAGDVLPASWQPHVLPYLPFQAGEAVYVVQPYPAYAHELLGPWQGLAVLCGYVAAVTAAAAVAVRRRDTTPSLRWRSRVRGLFSIRRRVPGSGAIGAVVSASGAGVLSPVVLAPVTVGPVTLAGAMKSEWIKFRSVRSLVIVCALTVAGIVVIGLIAAADSGWNGMTAAERAGFDPIGQSLRGVHDFADLPVKVLGVLVVTGEYTTGMIRATFCAVPRRLTVLRAKAGVFAPAVSGSRQREVAAALRRPHESVETWRHFGNPPPSPLSAVSPWPHGTTPTPMREPRSGRISGHGVAERFSHCRPCHRTGT